MHEMQTIVTDDRGICLSVCHAWSFDAAFVKSLWPFVSSNTVFCMLQNQTTLAVLAVSLALLETQTCRDFCHLDIKPSYSSYFNTIKSFVQ